MLRALFYILYAPIPYTILCYIAMARPASRTSPNSQDETNMNSVGRDTSDRREASGASQSCPCQSLGWGFTYVRVYIYKCVCYKYVHMYIPTYLPTHLPIYLSIYLSFYLSMRLSIEYTPIYTHMAVTRNRSLSRCPPSATNLCRGPCVTNPCRGPLCRVL